LELVVQALLLSSSILSSFWINSWQNNEVHNHRCLITLYLWLNMWVSCWIIPFSILNETPQFINHLLLNLKWNEWTILIVCAFIWHNLQANPFVCVGITCGLFNCPLSCPCYALCATFFWYFWFTYMFFGTVNPLTLFYSWFMGCTLILLPKNYCPCEHENPWFCSFELILYMIDGLP
jgi:hypothetical protein